MARRSRYGSYGRTSAAAPKPIKVVQPTVDLTGLVEAYDWMPVNKILGYTLALEWYSTNLQALMYGMTIDATTQKALEMASKLKGLGDSSPHDEEKDNAWRKTLAKYEAIWATHKLPKIEDALKQTVPGKSVAAIKTVLDNFAAAYGAFGVRFRLSMNADREFDANEISIPRAELAAMVGAAPLKTVVNEAVNVAKVTSVAMVTVDGVSKLKLDNAKFMSQLPVMMEAATTWALGTAGTSKPIGRVTPTKAPKAPKVPGAAGPIVRTRRWADTEVIHVLVAGNPFKGQMHIKYALVKDGMTIGDFKAARRALGNMGAGVGPIEDGVKRGLLRVG
jgi:hypothetical protein